MTSWDWVPWDSIGSLRFGMNAEEVHQVLGAPETAGPDFLGDYTEYYENATLMLVYVDNRLGEVEIRQPGHEVVVEGKRLLPASRTDMRKILRGLTDEEPVNRTGTDEYASLGVSVPRPGGALPRNQDSVAVRSKEYAVRDIPVLAPGELPPMLDEAALAELRELGFD